jgi:quinol monooxygenase YgiN
MRACSSPFGNMTAWGPDEEAIPLIRVHTYPIMQRQPGFRGFYAFRDEAEPEHGVSISLWSSRGAAIAAHQRVLEAMAILSEVTPAPPKVTAGAARVVAVVPPVKADTYGQDAGQRTSSFERPGCASHTSHQRAHRVLPAKPAGSCGPLQPFGHGCRQPRIGGVS